MQTWRELQSKHGLTGPDQLVVGGIFLVLVCARSLDGEHEVCVGKGTVGALALVVASSALASEQGWVASNPM